MELTIAFIAIALLMLIVKAIRKIIITVLCVAGLYFLCLHLFNFDILANLDVIANAFIQAGNTFFDALTGS